MDISVIGCGYLGAVHAVAMASLGHHVTAIESDAVRLAALKDGAAPFFEPGFADLLASASASGQVRFTADPAASRGSRVHFICVGTPQLPGSDGADLSYLGQALDALIPVLAPGDVVVGKCTVPVGTAARISARLATEAPGTTLIWNPEFLREGYAVHDTLSPDRIVYGLPPDCDPAAIALLDDVYEDQLVRQNITRLQYGYETSELVKVAANSFLATKISFINAVAEICEAAGADVAGVAQAIGMDARIGPQFLRAGLGFGGGCLPKDTNAFSARARELGAPSLPTLLDAVGAINERARQRAVRLIEQACPGGVAGAPIALLGAAFKPGTDDMRRSPAVAVALELARRGASVRVYDPEAGPKLASMHPELAVLPTAREAMTGAVATAVLTEWPQFAALPPAEARAWVANPVMIDCRSALDAPAWRQAGWTVSVMGAAAPAPTAG